MRRSRLNLAMNEAVVAEMDKTAEAWNWISQLSTRALDKLAITMFYDDNEINDTTE